MEDPKRPPADATPDEIDDGLAFAYGAGSQPGPAPSVLDRVRDLIGSKPQVSLRDAGQAGDTPMLKPLAPDEARSAGRYVVHGMLGQGGVGAVHRGHDQDLGRDVALKFLHEKYSGEPAILHRFVEEAQIGGQLQHPGIVPVYELGMADDRPFFAMKMVKGQTLAKKLAERSSPAQDRRTFLSIFEDVCQTMAYAHARGVVHRDLKPANVMIGSFGEVQVVDWGMGKVLAAGGVADEKAAADKHSRLSVIETVRSAGHGTQSVMGSVMGTPAYMPPEQARGDVAAMDERSDVFALGAILCEILTGLPPYVGEPGELIAMAAMARLDDARQRLADCSADRELIELTAECLMPAQAARPTSAEVVARRVHEHLAAVENRVHEARVEAAEAKVKADALRRTQKLGIALTTAIAAGLCVSLWFWHEADEQRSLAVAAASKEREAAELAESRRLEADTARAAEAEQRMLAEAQRQEAERQTEIAEAVSQFQKEMLAAADPTKMLGDKVTVLQITEAAVALLDKGSLEDQPLVEVGVRSTIGHTLKQLGRFDEAEHHLRRALAMQRAALPAEHRDITQTLSTLAHVVGDRGDFVAAEPLAREALRMSLAIEPPGFVLTAYFQRDLAAVLEELNKLTEAEQLHREALQWLRAAPPEYSPAVYMSLRSLAQVLSKQGKPAEAESLLREALTSARADGEAGPDVVPSILNSLGLALSKLGRLDEAEAALRESLTITHTVFPDEHPTTATRRYNLGCILDEMGELDEAESCYREALAVFRATMPDDSTSIGLVVSHLAYLFRRTGRTAEAEPLSRESLQIALSSLPEGHPGIGNAWNNLAGILCAQGKYAEAVPCYRKALEISVTAFRKDHPDNPRRRFNLAGTLMLLGRFEEAAPYFEEGIEIARAVLPPDDEEFHTALRDLGRVHVQLGKPERAIPLFEEALGITTSKHGRDHFTTANVLIGLGDAYCKVGRPAEGLTLLEEAWDYSNRNPESYRWDGSHLFDAYARAGDPADATNVARVLRTMRQRLDALTGQGADADLGRAATLASFTANLLDMQLFDEADPMIRESLATREKLIPDDWRTYNARSLLGAVLMGQNKLDEAEPLLLAGYRGLRERERDVSADSELIRNAVERLVRLYEASGDENEATKWRKQLEANGK